MDFFKADLHCHSLHSDGTFSGQDLILQAVEAGLKGLSITDHDSLDAYAEAKMCADSKGIALVPGVELTCSFGKKGVHLLGYAFNLKDERLQSLCQNQQKLRLNRFLAILNRLKLLGIDLQEKVFAKPQCHIGSLGRMHIAESLVLEGHAPTISEAFSRFLGEGKRAYVPFQGVPVAEAIHLIQQAKGFAVLAHPHVIRDRKLLREVLNMPLDGVEGYYAQFPLATNQNWLSVAAKKGWIVTGGSDFHGENKPFNRLGSAWTPKETFDYLLAHAEQVNRR
ncbi:MAG: hypothetical protein K0S07_1679 [Chlamydiales bacterium]|nr:hypothetical protein [Chlamydiales bacterium]